MRRPSLSVIAVLAVVAACAPTQGTLPAAEYVPAGRAAPATPLVQALHECRMQVESAGRQSAPATGPGPMRQIPAPPVFRPEHATVQGCMEAKGYRRAAPAH